jgi:hypothetical protein
MRFTSSSPKSDQLYNGVLFDGPPRLTANAPGAVQIDCGVERWNNRWLWTLNVPLLQWMTVAFEEDGPLIPPADGNLSLMWRSRGGRVERSPIAAPVLHVTREGRELHFFVGRDDNNFGYHAFFLADDVERLIALVAPRPSVNEGGQA